MIYLVRVNLDIEDKRPIKALRFQAAAETVSGLLKRGYRVVIMSHFGRPTKPDRKLSLKRFQKPLENKLRQPVIFFPKFNFAKIRKTIESSKNAKVFLLENLRFSSKEEKNDAIFAKQLASLGDRYMNDDFATSHRKEASIVAITKFLPSIPGPTLLNEVHHLKKAAVHPQKPFTLIIGGAKIEDKIGVVKHLLPKVDYVLMGGGAANTFLKVRGVNIKSSLMEPDLLATARRLIKNKKIILPSDYHWQRNKIMDIGPKTSTLYAALIKKSRTVIWGGPMGYFEDKNFNTGSYKIARAVVASKSFSVVGGGETDSIIIDLGLQKKIGFLSLGGGAMLAFLAHKELPGLKALKIRY